MKLCFNLAKSVTSSLSSDVASASSSSETFIRRRFGITSTGNAVALNILGEPINITGDIFQDITFSGIIRKIEIINDETSVVGGKPSSKQRMEVYVDPTLDIVEGDVIIRVSTISQQRWFRVKGSITAKADSNYYLTCISETRSTK